MTTFHLIYYARSKTRIENYDENLLREFNDFLLEGKEETNNVKNKSTNWYKWVKPFVNIRGWILIIILLIIVTYVFVFTIIFTSFLIIIVFVVLLFFGIIESKQNQFKQLVEQIFYYNCDKLYGAIHEIINLLEINNNYKNAIKNIKNNLDDLRKIYYFNIFGNTLNSYQYQKILSEKSDLMDFITLTYEIETFLIRLKINSIEPDKNSEIQKCLEFVKSLRKEIEFELKYRDELFKKPIRELIFRLVQIMSVISMPISIILGIISQIH